MNNRISFIPYEPIGSNGFIFIEELESKIVKRKDTKKGIRHIRMGKVICPYCHKEIIRPLLPIYQNKIKSCGCLKNKLASERMSKWNIENCTKDIAGQTAGDWTALYPTGRKSKNNTHYWMCVCPAGHTREILVTNFGRHLCCMDCNHRSNGERKIADILDRNEIIYDYEKKFSDCINKETNRLMSFDFYLPDYKCCIEYDGEQHYFSANNKTNNWFNNEETEKIKYRDRLKDEYCYQNNIKIIRIPYYDYDSIDDKYVLNLLKS